MADQKISAMTHATTPLGGTEKIPGVQSSNNVYITPDDITTPCVLKAGSTMTGALVLNADPGTALGAATKQYVDAVTTSVSTLDGAVIKKNGSVTYTANQPMGSFKLTGLAAGSTNGDSVRYEQVILVSGANAFGADQSMGTYKITNLGTPASSSDAATKGYVDGLLGASSESASGIIELATQSETNTGSDDARAVTPLKLQTCVRIKPGTGTQSILYYNTLSANTASGNYSTAFGIGCTASGGASFTTGSANTASGSQSAAIGGNIIFATGTNSAALAGALNIASAQSSIVLAGENNNVGGARSIIGGGDGNNVSGTDAGIIAGTNNTLTANGSVIIGGNSRTLSQSNTTVVETLRSYGGNQIFGKTTITSDTTLGVTNHVVLVDTTSGNINITLPASPVDGQLYRFFRTSGGGNTLTLTGNGHNINGSATYTAMSSQYNKATIIYDSAASTWFILNT